MSAQLEAKPVLRPMALQDLDRVMEVERRIYAFPWTRGNFSDSIKAGYSCWVYEMEGALVGYGVMMLAAREAHLLNLSVASGWQGRGMGRRLLAEFVRIAQEYRARSLYLEVRPSNLPAIRLYKNMGFQVSGLRPGYYPAEQGREDAILMELAL